MLRHGADSNVERIAVEPATANSENERPNVLSGGEQRRAR
jgi:hypothetical protein